MSEQATTQNVRGSEQIRDKPVSTTNPFYKLIEGRYWAYLLLIPSLILVAAVVVYPVISGVWLSFHEYRLNRPALGRPWIGLEHYRDMLDDRTIRIALKNTLIWVTVGSISQFILGMITALALHRSLKGFRIAAVLVLIPWLLPSVVSANMWRLMLDSRLGVVNEILGRIGLVEQGHAWFTNPSTALYEVLAVELWKNFAFFTLFFLAGLYAIPNEYYEASSVDGSGTLHRFRDITIPMLMPVIVGATILRVIGLFNSPDILLVLTGGGPGNATQTLALYGFQTAYLRFDFGYAAALSVLALFCLMAFTVVYVRASGVTRE